jgi:nitroimidazol reductase NimA-like FMN-containing flavoprotein (pyridoxamine 5'-phosphate oxidase superfamily)
MDIVTSSSMVSSLLSDVMHATISKATPLSKRVFGRAMGPEEVEIFLNEEKTATLVTVKSNCAPHASIGSFSYNDGRLYFYSHKDSARQKNLKRNSHVAVTVIDEWRRQVIMEGDAKILGTASELRSHEAADSFRMKYGDFAGNRESSSYVVEVTPNEIFTFKSKG